MVREREDKHESRKVFVVWQLTYVMTIHPMRLVNDITPDSVADTMNKISVRN